MTKFGIPTQILTEATEMWEHFRYTQIQDGGRTPYWKSFLAITRLRIARLRRNLDLGSVIARIQKFGDENVKFRKSNMADGRRNLVRRHKFYLRRRKPDNKIRNSQIQDGGRTPYWKSFFGYNSAPSSPIKTKFGVRRQNRTHTKVG